MVFFNFLTFLMALTLFNFLSTFLHICVKRLFVLCKLHSWWSGVGGFAAYIFCGVVTCGRDRCWTQKWIDSRCSSSDVGVGRRRVIRRMFVVFQLTVTWRHAISADKWRHSGRPNCTWRQRRSVPAAGAAGHVMSNYCAINVNLLRTWTHEVQIVFQLRTTDVGKLASLPTTSL